LPVILFGRDNHRNLGQQPIDQPPAPDYRDCQRLILGSQTLSIGGAHSGTRQMSWNSAAVIITAA
jgi:hypothetical protein